ncbi:MAG: family 78 glycoside hydrolase catalytic domain [Clostridia bacterium]|nr:family 78 glycoside hydrolase catalytic domain [Clostridia bacterium]
MRPYNVKLNLLNEPYGLNKNSLSLSFALSGETAAVLQAVRVVIASGLQQETFVVDTDFFEVNSNLGIHLSPYATKLQEGCLYTCKVQAKTDIGVSDWSKPLAFSIAPKWNPTAVWCETDRDFCLLRRRFTLEKMPAKALLYVTARSPEPSRQFVYHVTCNGEYICQGPARYGKEHNTTLLYYETVDVTSALQEGNNCFAAACYTQQDHMFAACLVAYDEQGAATVLWESGRDFEAMDATEIYRPDQSIGTNYFVAHGQNINGEVYPFGWDEGLDCASFVSAVEKGPITTGVILTPFPAPVVKRFIKPAAHQEWLEDGTLFVDLGAEIVGDFSLQTNCDEAKDITIGCGEELSSDGRVRFAMRTTNVYQEHWRLPAKECTLTAGGLKTFRYLEIQGLTEDDSPQVYGCAYHIPFEPRDSFFSTSNELLNEMYDLCKYTIQATNQNLYVDSQSRERCAYEGDVLINMLTAAAVQDCNALSRFSVDYLLTHRTWPAEYVLFCILMARADYEYTGDQSLVASRFDLLKENLYLSYLDESVGLIRNITMAGNVTDAVLVDWPMSERDGYDYQNALYNTVMNSVHYRALADLAYLARELNRQEEAAHYQTLADSLKETMIEKLYDSERGCFVDGLTDQGEKLTHAAQHATAYALYAGVYRDSDMQAAMVEFLKEQGNIRMSVYGAHFLLEGLYKAGAGAYANALLMSDDVSDGARTWAYMLDKLNATITTEAWNTVNKANMTWSHPWGSACGAALIRGLFGIHPVTPGFETFSVRLQPAGLRYGAVTVPTVQGTIEVHFNLTAVDEQAEITLRVPSLCTAHVSIPGKEGGSVMCNGKPVKSNYQNGCYHWTAKGGEHIFQVV